MSASTPCPGSGLAASVVGPGVAGCPSCSTPQRVLPDGTFASHTAGASPINEQGTR
ncbi:MAG TPA: hypothetical protein VHE83_08970 [Mycobacteriales bacterium]|nr:hypothetical protein [Mycobacteriales bacterium]